jgi:hypothetical protein
VTSGKVKAVGAHRFVLSPMRGGDGAGRQRSIVDSESLVVGGVRGEDLLRGEIKGEVRLTVNRVHSAWGGVSPRKESTTAFPHDSNEVDGSLASTMDEMQRGARRVSCGSMVGQKSEREEKRQQ